MVLLSINFTNYKNLVHAFESFDYQKFTKTQLAEFCQHNDQASDLCYLLAQDVLDYQKLGYNLQKDLQVSDNFTDYAHTAGVISLPIFLRYLPALSKLAKKNMIVASAVAIVGGAIAFKKYYDSFTHTLMIKKVWRVDQAGEIEGWEEIPSSQEWKINPELEQQWKDNEHNQKLQQSYGDYDQQQELDNSEVEGWEDSQSEQDW